MADMIVKLYELSRGAAAQACERCAGVSIRRAGAFERHQVVAWVEARFPPGWGSECRVAFSRQPISCFVAVKEGRLLGFACYNTTARGFFGPTGVDEAARGAGVGTALLMESLEALMADGHAYAIIGGVGPRQFYERAVGAVEIPGSTPGLYRDRIKPSGGD